jgi:DNA-binding transcriptional LysR family regulator
MNLSTRQMRAFLQVARLGNFTRAAEQAHITQAGLSILIREMEKQLGCRLFDRTTRVVTLTPSGRRLLPVVERLVTDLDDVAAQLGAEGDEARQTLRIAATPLVSSHLLPQVFNEVVVHRDRRVVAELDGLVDVLGARQRAERRRGQVVVQPPAHVLRIGLAAVAPPGVGLVGGVGLQLR